MDWSRQWEMLRQYPERPGPLIRRLMAMVAATAIADLIGLDLSGMFGPKVQDLGFGRGKELGDVVPTMRGKAPWAEGPPPDNEEYNPYAAFIGNVTIPGLPSYYGPSIPIQIGITMKDIFMGVMNDDADLMPALQYEIANARNQEWNNVFPGRRVVNQLSRGYYAMTGKPPPAWVRALARDDVRPGREEGTWDIMTTRNRLSHTLTTEQLRKSVFLPGPTNETMRQIRLQTQDYAFSQKAKASKVKANERFLEAFDAGDFENALTIMQNNRIRIQDVSRLLEKKAWPGWVRNISGDAETRGKAIVRHYTESARTEKNARESIFAITVHFNDLTRVSEETQRALAMVVGQAYEKMDEADRALKAK